ncbi:MAG: DUF1302 family protein [Parvibaculum sp.]|nr:DUF1302 family protein [Parvibaculum sp.]
MPGKFRPAKIAGLTGLLLTAGTMNAYAFDFHYGDINGYFDTTVSTGMLFRVEKPDAKLAAGSSGDRNFDNGDMIDQTSKAVHDFNLQYHNVGIFARGTYFYNSVMDTNDRMNDATRQAGRSDAKFLDYFVYGDWDLSDTSRLHLRAGSQVVSWGESTFFTNGINQINPQDVVKARQAGAEVKEILVPLPMVWAGVDITGNWSIEAMQMLRWQETEIDPVGSYFSTSNLLGDGINSALGPLTRMQDREADDTGTYGVSTHFTVEALDYTDFGLYFINYSSYNPAINVLPDPDGVGPAAAHYFADFVEDIKLYGASFNATVGKTSVAGEFSYQDNFPIQLGGAGLGAAVGAAVGGTKLDTYRRLGYSQGQVTVTYVFPPNVIPTTSQTTSATEIVWGHVYQYTNEADLGGVTSNATAIRTSIGPQWAGLFTLPYLGRFDLNGTIDFQMGLSGLAPAGGPPGKNTNQLGLALEAVHANKLSMRAEYTRFAGPANGRRDRDYAGVSLKYSF